MKRTWLFALSVLLSLLAFMLQTLAGFAQNEPLMTRAFERFGRSSLLTEAQGPPAAQAVTGYLSGRQDTLSHPGLPSFTQRETLHMQDVRHLVRCARLLPWVYAGTVLVGVVLFLPKRGGCALLHGFWLGVALFLGAAAALGLWAALSFDSLFILFHRLLFSNDLWLLDPAEDLLIGLMPTPFFVFYFRHMLLALSWIPVAGGIAYAVWRQACKVKA